MNKDIPQKAGKREWIGLIVIALPCMLYSMDLTVLHLAVPHLSADLKPSSSEMLWIVDIYGFLLAGLLITMGTLGDRIGRRLLLLIGAFAFGIASVLAAFSASPGMLIINRAILGIAGATLAPSTLSLIRNMFLDPKQRTFAIGVWITSFSVGAGIGPPLGGFLLEYFWWGSVFLIAVPVMLLILILGPMLLPEYRNPDAGRLDLVSAGMSLIAVLAVIYGLKQIAQDGIEWFSMMSILAGLAVGFVFLLRQKKLIDPLIDLQLFRFPAFSTPLAIYSFGFFVNFGSFLFIAQFLQLVLGLSPLQAGFWSMPFSGGFIIGAMLTPVIVSRVRPASVMMGGLVCAAIGFFILGQAGNYSGLVAIVTGSIVFSLGLAPVFTLATDMIVGTAPPERAGAASAISETGSEFGGALGIAVLGSVGVAVYRSFMENEILRGIPSELMEAARDTLGGALGASNQLPDHLGNQLMSTARLAFTQAFELTALICSAITIILAILALIFLKREQADTGLEQETDLRPLPEPT